MSDGLEYLEELRELGYTDNDIKKIVSERHKLDRKNDEAIGTYLYKCFIIFKENDNSLENKDLLIRALAEIVTESRGELNLEQLKQVLVGFDGIITLDDEKFNYVRTNDTTCAYYANNQFGKNVIVMPKSLSKEDMICNLKTYLKHELVHAIIGRRIKTENGGEDDLADFSVNSVSHNYGVGLEEGIASSIAYNYGVSNEEPKFSRNQISYYYNVRIVSQLNCIYQNYSGRKYSSFQYHVLKEPENTFRLLGDMFLKTMTDNLKPLNEEEKRNIMNLAYRAALYNLLILNNLVAYQYGFDKDTNLRAEFSKIENINSLFCLLNGNFDKNRNLSDMAFGSKGYLFEREIVLAIYKDVNSNEDKIGVIEEEMSDLCSLLESGVEK